MIETFKDADIPPGRMPRVRGEFLFANFLYELFKTQAAGFDICILVDLSFCSFILNGDGGSVACF